MDEQRQDRSAGWGLPRPGSQDETGASWEGEGTRARREPPRAARRGRALLVVALGLLLGLGAVVAALRGADADAAPDSGRVERGSSPAGGAPGDQDSSSRAAP